MSQSSYKNNMIILRYKQSMMIKLLKPLYNYTTRKNEKAIKSQILEFLRWLKEFHLS